MIPLVIVGLYLVAVVYVGVFAFRRAERERRRRGLLPRRPLAGPVRVRAVAVRHQHDGVLDPRLVGPRLHQRHRHLRPDGLVVGADHPAVAVLHRHPHLVARPPARLHDAGADVPRSLGVRPHRHGDLRGAGGPAGAVHHHRRDGRRHHARRAVRRAGAVLGRRRAGRAGRHELRVLRRHARHRLGEHAADADVPRLRPARGGGGRRRHGRLRPRVLRDARHAGPGRAADARARLALVFLQLHLHPALVDRLPAHRHLLPDGEEALALQADGGALPDLHAGDLAAVRLPRRRRQPRHRRAGHQGQAGRAGDDRRRRADARRGRARSPAPRRVRRRRDAAAGRALRAGVADRAARRLGDGRGDGQRFADPGAVDDVHRGRLHLLRRHRALRAERPGADGAPVRRPAHARRLRPRAAGAAVDLRSRQPVRLRRLLGAVAAAGRGAVLAAQHQVGRAGGRDLGRGSGSRRSPRSR